MRRALALGGERLGWRQPRILASMVAAVLGVAALAFAGAARAEVIRDFSFELNDPQPYGAYTVVFHESASDTASALVAPLTRYTLRFPAGMSLRREFLTKRSLCDAGRLLQTRNPATCKNAQLGTGRALVQLVGPNNALLFGEPIPATLFFFLAEPMKRGAVASMLSLGIPDPSAPVVKKYPIIQANKPLLEIHLFNDPTPDGVFGYRFELPVSIAGLPFSALKVDSTFPGLTLRKRVRKCARPRTTGAARCRKKTARVRKIFWAGRPKCPRSGMLTFQASYSYAALPPSTVTHEIGCLNFPR
jgi:hypothetical protein